MSINIDLSEQIKAQIENKGPITIAEFIDFALNKYKDSYYSSNHPIGKDGDFITAPEISQLFGEMIGVWAVGIWESAGKPKRFNLIEMGPGNGTLMKDLLRATKHVKEFHEAINVCLVEINIDLKSKQKEAIKHKRMHWYSSYDDVPQNIFSIIIANEFFDALPINQYIKKKGEWRINMVDLNDTKNHLCINHYEACDNVKEFLTKEYSHIADDGIVEINDSANTITKSIALNLNNAGGAALIIDYGYTESRDRSFISTLQSLKDHAFNPVFKDIGNADITSHINFTAIADTAKLHGAKIIGPLTQRDFLLSIHTEVRKSILVHQAKTIPEKEMIESGYQRLIDPSQMGKLFKVLIIHPSV